MSEEGDSTTAVVSAKHHLRNGDERQSREKGEDEKAGVHRQRWKRRAGGGLGERGGERG